MTKLKPLPHNDWKRWTIGFPYEGINDPKYIKDRDAMFNESGNGWWCEWTKLNTPIKGIYTLKAKEDAYHGKEKK